MMQRWVNEEVGVSVQSHDYHMTEDRYDRQADNVTTCVEQRADCAD